MEPVMTLDGKLAQPHQDRSGEYMIGWECDVSTEIADAERRAATDLILSGVARKALRAGDRIPAIVLSDSDGWTVNARDLLTRGPLIVPFHRGLWCPYGNLALRTLEGARSEIEARGASIVVISQQTRTNSRRSKRLNGLGFPILVDADGLVAAQFGVRWNAPAHLREVYKRLDVDLARYNNDESWMLPIPALFVVGSGAVIVYAEIDPDATRTTDPANVFPVLDLFKGRWTT